MSPIKSTYSLLLLLSIVYLGSSCKTSWFPDGGAKAMAVLKGVSGNDSIRGTVKFNQDKAGDAITVTVNITGIPIGLGPKHGIHVHQSTITDTGDSTAAICGSAGPHFNPFNLTHGDISSSVRHVGDFGNVISSNGTIQVTFTDKLAQLYGPLGIIGRTIVLHQLEDDLGLKDDAGSKSTGNAGARLACGVIGISP